MKKLLLSLAAVAAMSVTADAKLVLDKLTIENFGVTETKYADAEYTSPITGVTYKANIAKANESNGSGMQFRKGDNSGLVITANPKNYKVSKLLVDRSMENQSNATIWVYTNTTPYTSPADLFSKDTWGSADGAVNKNENSTVTFETPQPYVGFKAYAGSCYLNYVTFAYEVDDNAEVKEAAGLAFDVTSCDAVLGQEFSAPVLTKATDAEITYTSSNEEVAKVDAATGAVTLVGMGTTVITASAAETEKFLAGAASYSLTVEDPSLVTVYESSLMNEDCGFTFDSGISEMNPWSIDSKYGLKASAYVGGACVESSAYAVSPVIDLTGYKAPVVLTFEQAINQFKKDNELINPAQVKTYISVNGKEEGEKYFLDEFKVTFPATFSWNYEKATVSLDNYAGTKMYIGFLYMSNTSIAGTWEIKNMKVIAKKDGNVSVESFEAEDAVAEYFDLQGRRVANPEKGLYICKKGAKATKVIF